ncbi:MAG: ribosome silencing factor [Gemmatimonadota bacterium]|jgi:ribosome-associated protein
MTELRGMREVDASSFEMPEPVERAADLALERKAEGVVVLDLRGISSATDFFLIGSGNSDIQVRAIADHVIEELKKEDVRPGHVEGREGGRWVLIDYIDFVVHVFHPHAREFYQLENLWGDAPQREIED